MEYYKVLGVDKTASTVEIKKAYRRMARQYHPDLNPGKNTANHFIRIKNAYDTLLDPVKRQNYDDAMCYTGNSSTMQQAGSTQYNYNENVQYAYSNKKNVDETPVSRNTQLITFFLADEEYAFKISDVTGITGYASVTPLENTFNIVEGMVQARGEELPVIDLAKNFGFARVGNPEKNRIILVEIEKIKVGLIVDSVPQVLDLSNEMIIDLPDTTTGKSFRYMQVGNIEGRTIIILDLGQVLSPETLAALKEMAGSYDKRYKGQ